MKKILFLISFFIITIVEINAQTRIDFESYTIGQTPPTSDIVVGGSASPTSTLTIVDMTGTTGNSSGKALKMVVKNYGEMIYLKNMSISSPFTGTLRIRYCLGTNLSNDPGFRLYSSNSTTSLGTACQPTWNSLVQGSTNLNVWRVVEFNLSNWSGLTAGKLALGFNQNSATFYIDDVEIIPQPSSTTTPFIANDFDATRYISGDYMRMNPLDNSGKGTAVVAADPANSSNKVVQVTQTTGGTAAYFRQNVSLPSGINLSSYGKIAFDLRTSGTVSGKMYIAAIPYSGVGLGTTTTFVNESSNTTQGTANTWVTKVYSLTSAPSANSFILDLGINTSTAAASYYIDNIKLCKSITTGPTASAASGQTSSAFNANWAMLDGAESYQLDVATDNGFTSMVSGYSNLNVGNVLTYTVSGLSPNTTYYYRVRGYNPGYTSSASSTITSLTLPGAPTANAATSVTTYSFLATWSAPSGGATSYQIDVASDASFSSMVSGYNNLAVASGISQSITGLSPNTTYYYRVRAVNASGAGAVSNSITQTTATPQSSTTDYFRSAASGNWGVISTWQSSSDNSNWISATLAPSTSATSVSILNGHTITVDNDAITPSLVINNGGVVTVSAGKQLTISTTLTNNGILNLLSATDGTVATILTPTTIGGSGTANVDQHLNGARNWYISSPVTGATSPVNYVYYRYREPGDNIGYTTPATAYWESIAEGSILENGRGYIALPAGESTLRFSGILNSGSIETGSLTRTNNASKLGFNLVGNPYPAYLNLAAMDTTNVLGSFWIRSRNQADNGYDFDTYNMLLGQGISKSGKSITSFIPPMQAFWVRVKQGHSPTTLIFNSSMCQHINSVNNLFRARSANNVNQQVLNLQVSNGINMDETILAFNPNASNQIDAYDSPKMAINSVSIPEIYTLIDNEQYAINGMNSIPYDTEIPIGFTTGKAGDFSLKASQMSNFDAGTQVILIDYLDRNNPVISDLTDGGSYTFTSEVSTNNTNRFALIFKAPSINTEINQIGNKGFWISKNSNNQIVINGILTNETSISVYNSIGQNLISKNLKSTTKVLDNSLMPGMYLVSVTNAGKRIICKVILN